jgi:hypothetical protein
MFCKTADTVSAGIVRKLKTLHQCPIMMSSLSQTDSAQARVRDIQSWSLLFAHFAAGFSATRLAPGNVEAYLVDAPTVADCRDPQDPTGRLTGSTDDVQNTFAGIISFIILIQLRTHPGGRGVRGFSLVTIVLLAQLLSCSPRSVVCIDPHATALLRAGVMYKTQS